MLPCFLKLGYVPKTVENPLLIFNQWTIVFTGPIIVYLAFILSEIRKLFLDNFFLYSIWTTPLKFTLITSLRSLVKIKKYITTAHAYVHFKIASHAKNG